ncbi:hypothetical protein Gotur_019364 [Gossypium turneri]
MKRSLQMIVLLILTILIIELLLKFWVLKARSNTCFRGIRLKLKFRG